MKKKTSKFNQAATMFFSVVMILSILAVVPAVQAESENTYTLDADFDLGTLVGVEHDTVHDQLQLDENPSTYPLLWIANAGEDTLSKFDTDTGKELARYRTWFGPTIHGPWEGPAPSRTAVDKEGNVYVANRHFETSYSSVMKVLVDDWIDRNGNGMLDTATDTNDDGTIDASEIMPLTDLNGNGLVDPEEITDERVAWIVKVDGPTNNIDYGRSLAIDNDENLWLGFYNSMTYVKLSSADGSVLSSFVDVSPNTPYGSLIDKDGILWGASLSSNLLKLDTNTNTKLDEYYAPDSTYGIAIGNDKVYMASQSGNTYVEFDPVTATFSTPAAVKYYALGIAVDSEGNIVTGDNYGNHVSKFNPDGSLVWDVVPNVRSEIRGVVVDSNDNVWTIHRDTNKISKYSGIDGTHLGTFNTGYSPYTYSDATGLGHMSSIIPTGTWKVTFDSGADDTEWGNVLWTDDVPSGASVQVSVRSSNTEEGLELESYFDVDNGVEFSNKGRYIQILVRLTASPDDESPILYDLTVMVGNQPPEANPGGLYVGDEGSAITFDGSESSDSDVGDSITYEWDLDNDGIFESNGMTVSNTWPDDYSGIVTLRVTDSFGASDTESTTVTVNNVAPEVTLDTSYFATVPITLRIGGQGKVGNSVAIEIIQDGKAIASDKIIRVPGSPNEQEVTVSATIDLSKPYSGKLIFDTETAYNGGTPVWVIIDGVTTKLTTFNTQKKDPSSYHQTYDFALDGLFTVVGKEITFTGSATDPGEDDLNFEWAFGDGEIVSTLYPWIVGGPHTVTDTVKHTYTAAGSYDMMLTVTDDDSGVGTDSRTISVS